MADPPPPCPYATLGVPPTASTAAIKAAFRAAARRTHPDRQRKGAAAAAAAQGGPALPLPPPPLSPSFAAVRAAYELLVDPPRRAAHDACAAAAPGGVAPPPAAVARATAARRAARARGGGEDALLACWAPPGPVTPSAQLVVTCEACRRPASAACWVCGMDLCAFCTRTPHWKGSTALHWPLINTPHALETRLARRELEAKRVEDAEAEDRARPGWAPQSDRAEAAAFAAAAAAALAAVPDPALRAATHAPALARYYLWDQTQAAVVVAVHVPGSGGGGGGGGGGRAVRVACDGGTLSVRRAGCPAVVHRRLAGAVCASSPPAVAVTEDGRTAVIVLAKAAPWPPWRALFQGDSDGARAAAPPYRVVVEQGEASPPPPPLPPSSSASTTTTTTLVTLELPLPWWVAKDDVAVACTAAELRVTVAGGAAARLVRRFQSGEAAPAVLPEETAWSLVDGEADPAHPARRPGKVLVVALSRAGEAGAAGGEAGLKKAKPGPLFFACDEDAFGLSAPLAGAVVAVGGVGHVRGDGDGACACRPVRTRADLPPGSGGVGVYDVLAAATAASSRPAGGGGGGGGGLATPGRVEGARVPTTGEDEDGGGGGGGGGGDDEDDEDDAWEF